MRLVDALCPGARAEFLSRLRGVDGTAFAAERRQESEKRVKQKQLMLLAHRLAMVVIVVAAAADACTNYVGILEVKGDDAGP